jgi:hypothetical protein
VWWYRPAILAPGRLRQETREFEARLVYTGRPCLKTRTKAIVSPDTSRRGTHGQSTTKKDRACVVALW